MSRFPNFASTPRAAMAPIAAANVNRDGTGTIVDVLVAGAQGSRVDRVLVQGVATTTDGMVRLFLSDGVNTRLFKEVEVPAIVPSAVIPAFAADIALDECILPTGWKLRAATHNAEAFVVHAFGGDFS